MILSKEEYALFSDNELLLRKRIIAEKINNELEELKVLYKDQFNQLGHESILVKYLTVSPKISKGENYKGFPYFILDYPRVFGENETFAIRSMVLWGNFFSFTLHISGQFQKEINQKLLSNKKEFNAYYLCINDTPWEYLYTKDNYQLINSLSPILFEKSLIKKPFIKISTYHSLFEYPRLKSHAKAFLEKINLLIN